MSSSETGVSSSSLLRSLDDDSLEFVCSKLSVSEVLKIGLACVRLRRVTESEGLWEDFCKVRWERLREGPKWLAEVKEEGCWREAFAQKESKIKLKGLPVFAMAAPLSKGVVFHLHLFEPRYKWLIRRATEDHESLFVFCGRSPVAGEDSAKYSWICAATDVQIVADGRANFGALPLARCRIDRIWQEAVPDEESAPPLDVADVEELPTSDEVTPPRQPRLRFIPHRTLLELLIANPEAMRDLELTEENILELLLLHHDPSNSTTTQEEDTTTS